MLKRTLKIAVAGFIAIVLLIVGLTVFPLCRCEHEDALASPPGQLDGRVLRDDVRDRLGVVVVGTSDPLRGSRVPVGWYKNYTADGGALPGDPFDFRYTPVLLYQGKRDNFRFRGLLRLFWNLGYIPHNPKTTLCSALAALSLEGLEVQIRHRADRHPPGTMFVAGSEPGYHWSDDDRTPREIVDDSRKLRHLLDGMDRGYRLALGGISTPRTELTRSAYGMEGVDFLARILDLAGDLEFDAFVIHPYPADFAGASFADTKQQIIDFRRVLAARGMQDKDLIIGEVGIPFRDAQADDVAGFLEEIVRFSLSYRDPEIGHPGDDYRLAQRTFWYLMAPPSVDIPGITDNPSMDHELTSLATSSGQPTPLGRRLEAIVAELERPEANAIR
ncbi:MAG: hypothetical protein GY722_12795 [bacterium]|nr:hypothetical protein [bacterium]